jgi:hypothetical protein
MHSLMDTFYHFRSRAAGPAGGVSSMEAHAATTATACDIRTIWTLECFNKYCEIYEGKLARRFHFLVLLLLLLLCVVHCCSNYNNFE